jgi:hypothetical protein
LIRTIDFSLLAPEAKIDLQLLTLVGEGSIATVGTQNGEPRLWLLSVNGFILRVVPLKEQIHVLRFFSTSLSTTMDTDFAPPGYIVTGGTALQVVWRHAHNLKKIQTFFCDGQKPYTKGHRVIETIADIPTEVSEEDKTAEVITTAAMPTDTQVKEDDPYAVMDSLLAREEDLPVEGQDRKVESKETSALVSNQEGDSGTTDSSSAILTQEEKEEEEVFYSEYDWVDSPTEPLDTASMDCAALGLGITALDLSLSRQYLVASVVSDSAMGRAAVLGPATEPKAQLLLFHIPTDLTSTSDLGFYLGTTNAPTSFGATLRASAANSVTGVVNSAAVKTGLSKLSAVGQGASSMFKKFWGR